MNHYTEIEIIRYLNRNRAVLSEPGLASRLAKRYGLARYEVEALIEVVAN